MPRRRLHALARTRVTGGLVAFALVSGVLTVAARIPQGAVRVVFDRRSVTVPAHRATIAGVLEAADVRPRDGALFSAVSHRVLDRRAERAIIWLDGRAASAPDRVRDGDRVTLVNGTDRTEPIIHRTATVPGGGLPPVETTLWHPPVDGVDDLLVGARSGEVVRRTTVAAPTPATLNTDNVVALTFDDGPDPRYTPTLLQILHDEGVTATFCIVSHVARRHPEIVQAIAAAGHRLCDHTEHHVEHLDLRSPQEIDSEIGSCQDFIAQVTGREPTFYRAPGGTLSQTVIDTAHRRGMRVLGWSVDPSDWVPQAPPVLLMKVLTHVRPGAIVLLHDGGGKGLNTISMVQELIHDLRFFGYTIVAP